MLLKYLAPMLILFSCKTMNESEVKIIAGKEANQDSPAISSAVLILSKGKQHCTATLIAPNLLLTAKHCIRDTSKTHVPYGEDLNLLSLVFNDNGKYGPRKEVKISEATGYLEDVTLDNTYPNFDIAFIKFDGDVPANYKPIEILRSPSSLAGNDILLAGYGRNKIECKGESCFGTLQEGMTKVAEYINNSRYFHLIRTFSEDKVASCYGDSGGPAYLKRNGIWYLAGVTNGEHRNLMPSMKDADGDCSSGESIYTFAGDYADWIEKSSAVQLTHNPQANPAGAAQVFTVLPADPSAKDYALYNNYMDPTWYVVNAMYNSLATTKSPEEMKRYATQPEELEDAFKDMKRFTFKVDPVLGTTSPSIKPIQILTNLEYLSISRLNSAPFTEPQALPGLSKLKNLKTLEIHSVEMGNFDFIKGFSLSEFIISDVDHLDLKKISFEPLIPSLERLSINLNPSSKSTLDLESIPWKRLSRLKSVRLDSPTMTSFSALKDAPALESLNLGYSSPIEDFSPLAAMPNLREFLWQRPSKNTSEDAEIGWELKKKIQETYCKPPLKCF